MLKTLIYTTLAINDIKYAELFYDWIFSIRTLGQYTGEILVGDYGVSEDIIEKFKDYDVRFVKLPNRDRQTISNYRNVDMIPILEEYDDDYKFVHFDVDIWFQSDINPLFGELDKVEGCYFGLEQRRTCRWRGPNDEQLIKEYGIKQEKLLGFIFGGWIAGKKKPFLEKLNLMKDTFESDGWTYREHGTDQTMVTYLFDENKDDCTGDKWGKSYYFCEYENNKWQITDEFTERFNISKEVCGMHLVEYSGNNFDKSRRFKNNHPKLFEQEWKKLK